jgi:glutamyl-tRNA reductase
LLLVGTHHRIAHVDSRERLAASIGEAGTWLASTRERSDAIAELFVLATCHRVEIYAAAADSTAARAEVLDQIDGGPRGERLGPSAPRYVLTGVDAARHLCRVACGLDSVIVGEAEISGQLRRAATIARDAGTLGPYLERVLAGALRASGRARAETHIGRGVTSAASAGVTLALSLLGSLAGRTVMVVGAGQAGRQVLSRLSRLDMAALLVASRSEKHARQAAAESGATPIGLDAVVDHLRQVDVVVTALQTPVPIFDAARCGSRADRPLLVIDLSVPRAVSADVALVAGVTLRSVDDLGDIARESLARREQEIPRVEAIAHDEAARAYEQFRVRAARSAGGPA